MMAIGTIWDSGTILQVATPTFILMEARNFLPLNVLMIIVCPKC